MATSGSVDFIATRDQIIQLALENLGVMSPGDTTSSASFTDHSSGLALLLNGLAKQHAYPADGSPGMQVYHLRRGYLFLQKGEHAYTLGPTVVATAGTDKFAHSYVRSTINATEAAGQTVITVNDNGTITNGDRIGIVLDTGYVQWTTVNGVPTDNGATIDVTISVALTSAASTGNAVYTYATTAQGRRPLSLVHVARRDSDTTDTALAPMLLNDYELIPKKTTEGSIARYYYEQSLTNGSLYFDAAASDVTDVARITYRSPPEDFDAAGNDLDFDPVWVRPLAWGLTVESAGRFGQEARVPYFKTMRDEALIIARNSVPEECNLYFQPGEAG